MKKLLFLSLLFFSSFVVYSQVLTFKAVLINVRIYSDSLQQFSEWNGWAPSNVIITITEQKIHIYSNKDQEYIIIRAIENSELYDKNVIKFDVISLNDERCILELIHWLTGENQMYVRKPTLELVYQIKKL